jgi:hypothetical protein
MIIDPPSSVLSCNDSKLLWRACISYSHRRGARGGDEGAAAKVVFGVLTRDSKTSMMHTLQRMPLR